MDVSNKGTHFIAATFPAINHWFGVAEISDEFSRIYIFITIFVNNYIQSSIILIFQMSKNQTKYLEFTFLKILF